jgi:hypothetical protein
MATRTYTFTARSADDPAHVVTFTLSDGRLSIGVGAALEYIEKALRPTGERDEEASGRRIPPWLRPTAIWLLQQRLGSLISVTDVVAGSQDDGLNVRIWIRLGGLRLAPITFAWAQVDNPGAARAFVEELDRRRQSVGHPGRFQGFLDYWAGWVAVAGLLLAVLVILRIRARGDRAG